MVRDSTWFQEISQPWLPSGARWRAARWGTVCHSSAIETWLGFMKDPQYILWWTNIAMENGPFIDGFPIKKIGIFHGYVSLPECISAFSIGKRSKQQQNRTIIWPWVKIHWCLDLTLTYSHKSVIEFPPETWYTKVDHRWPNFGGQPSRRTAVSTLWSTNKRLLKTATEIVEFPIKNGDVP